MDDTRCNNYKKLKKRANERIEWKTLVNQSHDCKLKKEKQLHGPRDYMNQEEGDT